MEHLLKVQDVADMLDVGVSTVYRWVEEGIIPHVKFPGRAVRFRPSDLEGWVEGLTRNTVGQVASSI